MSTGTNEYQRPQHFGAAGDTIPFLLNDEYHLFHLGSPPNTQYHPPRVRCSWTRLKSTDLMNWKRDAEAALVPSNSEDAYDHSGCWTGSVVTGPDGNMHIFYTGYNLPSGGIQVILHAKSSDPQGTRFEKPEGPISVTGSKPLLQYESTDFRDPYVFFNEGEGLYWMLVATRHTEGPFWTRGCIALLTSNDLETWTAEDKPLYSPNDIFCPECPELFTLPNGKWYLCYSRFSAPDAGTLYRISDNPRGPYRIPRDGSGGRFDGRRWYAAKSCPKAADPSKRIFFGWVHDYVREDSKWLWGGHLAHPREVSARSDGTLRMDMAGGVLEMSNAGARGKSLAEIPKSMVVNSLAAMTVKDLQLSRAVASQEYCLSFKVDYADAAAFGLLLKYDDNMRGHKIRFEPVLGDLFSVVLYTDVAPLDDFWADLTGQHIPKLVDGPELQKHGQIRLDDAVSLVVADDIIELYAGGKVITYRLVRQDAHTTDAGGTSGSHEGEGLVNGDQSKNPSTNGIQEGDGGLHHLGFFVEDGKVSFRDISIGCRE